MSDHTATGQMTGYLYQVLSSLLLILDDKYGFETLCIEKYDDVAFVDKDEPRALIQVKHQINRRGQLTDTCVDLWRTINSWCDTINEGKVDYLRTSFIILTTATAPNNSAAYFLKEDNNVRDVSKALELLLIAAENTQKTTKLFREKFLNLKEEKRKQLFANVYIYDASAKIQDVREELKKRIKWGTISKYEDCICEQLEGWWLKRAIEFLCSGQKSSITQAEVRAKLH